QGGGSDDRTQLHGKGCRAAHRRPRWARRQDPRARADAGVADGTIEHPGGDAEARETALAHAEQKIKSLTDRIAEIEVDAGAYRAKTERRIDELNASLQRERVELAVAQGALETTRRDYARLQRDMLAGRGAPQRGATLEEVSEISAILVANILR